MEYKEFTAKSLDEAITLATVELGITSDHLEYQILENGSSGFLGIGRKDVTIQARKKPEGSEEQESFAEPEKKEEKEEIQETVKEESAEEMKQEEAVDVDEITNKAKAFLSDVFTAMDMEVSIDPSFSQADRCLNINLEGPMMGVLIGKRGQTLDALQYLTNLAVNKHAKAYVRVKIDTEDYRNRRKETLENLAKNIAFKVKRSGKSVSLEAMNPYERRTIHYALQNDDEIVTYSEGSEPYRHVVVDLKK